MKLLIVIFLCLANLGISQTKIAYLSAERMTSPALEERNNTATSSNFEYYGGLIYVNAVLNGESGQFIFDTGAPTLVVNSRKNTGKSITASGISNSFQVGQVEVNSFEWANLLRENFQGLLVDVSHFQKSGAENLKGLIGYEIVADRAVEIDFQDQTISLFSYREVKREIKNRKPSQTISFELEGHLPVVEVIIEGKKYRFGIDTGSECNIMDERKLSEFTPQAVSTEMIQGLDQTKQKVRVGKINGIRSGERAVSDVKFLFSNISHLQSGQFNYQIDGLLGLSFLKGNKCIIDYPRQKIYFYN